MTNEKRILKLRNRHGRTVAHVENGCLVIKWRDHGEKGVATWTAEELLRMLATTEEARA